MLQDHDRIAWSNLASSRSYLRYPKTEYTVERNNDMTTVSFQTFVKGGNNRLVYVRYKVQMDNRSDPKEYMKSIEKQFEFECQLAINHHTFAPNVSIDEPFP